MPLCLFGIARVLDKPLRLHKSIQAGVTDKTVNTAWRCESNVQMAYKQTLPGTPKTEGEM